MYGKKLEALIFLEHNVPSNYVISCIILVTAFLQRSMMFKNGSKPTCSSEFTQRLLLSQVVSGVSGNEQLHAIIMCWNEVAH